MSLSFPRASRSAARLRALSMVAMLVLGAGCAQSSTRSGTGLPMSDADPRAATAFVKPADLAAVLAGTGEKPLLLHVGFKVLYRGGAIPGSKYVGPGNSRDGIAAVRAAVKDVPKDRAIVIYCGCCPWDHCPNMRPAYQALVAMGFQDVRALYTPKNLETDWIAHGYPIEQPAE